MVQQLLSQPSPPPVEHSAGLAYGYEILSFIQAGGGWALSILFAGVILLLARAYKSARDSEMELLRAWNDESKKLIKDSTAVSAQQAATNDAVADALDRLSQSVEHYEDSHGA